MGKAKRRGLVPANPVSDLTRDERPRQNGRDKRVLSEEEITAVLKGASKTFRVPIAVMLFGGLRLGEALGLRWQEVETADGFLHVRYQLSPLRELVELKTGAGRRDVVMIPQLAAMLREHKIANRRKAPTDFVFSAPDGRGRDQRSTARGVERALKTAGLEGQGISSHNLRHTFASLHAPRPHLRIVPGKLSGSPHIAHSRIETLAVAALASRGYETETIIKLYPHVRPAVAFNEAVDLEHQLVENLRAAA
jgi:integrase